ncbi:MAG: CHRD domain-containing protein, partial [Anaerolineae bacterium]|nr:CHRD domain-containing protein [Anaerolineae bacterium]
VVLTLAVTSTALAMKRLYKARLNTANELHDVVGSSATGSAILARRPDGMDFMISVRALSGPPVGAHIHAPATEAQNAGVLLTLCGNPGPAAVAACDSDYDAATDSYRIQGRITSSLLAQWGVTAATLDGYLEDGLAYVNVHTALNPAGEVRGQLIGQ